MHNLFNKGRLAALFALIGLSAINLSLMAYEDCCEQMAYDCCEEPSCNRFYIGAFGGGIYSDSSHISQFGTAFFHEKKLGPLPVIAEGHLDKTSTGFGGVQVGYEWFKPVCSGWSLGAAGEFEAFFFRDKKKGHLINKTLVGLPEHDFFNSFHRRTSVILANVVFTLHSDCLCGFSPYVGGGIGATHVSLKNADSCQVEPLESGINHFNSRRNDSSWAFAAQAKVGLSYSFWERFHLFAEYRYLFVDESNYIFGATNYENHVPTTPWNVRLKDTHYNAFAVGFQFDL